MMASSESVRLAGGVGFVDRDLLRESIRPFRRIVIDRDDSATESWCDRDDIRRSRQRHVLGEDDNDHDDRNGAARLEAADFFG